MRKYILTITVAAFIILFQACSCKTCGDNGEYYNVPDKIITKADQFVISKTGQDFYNAYLHFNYEESRRIDNRYYLVYNMRDLDREYVDELIYFSADTNGVVLKDYEVVGIPDCNSDPDKCRFELTRDQAIDIAENEGITEGKAGREVSFRWSSEFNSYVWHILSTEQESGTEDTYKANGSEIILSPADGTILAKRTWNIR